MTTCRIFAVVGFFIGLGLNSSALCLAMAASAANPAPSMTTVLGVEDLIRIAAAANPQVRQARAQYEAARHQILQAYAPQDPVASWTSAQNRDGLAKPSVENWGVSESFQFPGKSWLQGRQAHRNAEIARLIYLAAARDVRAQTEAVYYQTLLDGALANAAAENRANLERVFKVAQVKYAANQVTQSDLISAEFDLAQSSQIWRASLVAEENDEAALNQALGREPRSPLRLARSLDLKPLRIPLDSATERALATRQEILEAALSEKNFQTALALVRMEFLPDFNASYTQNHYLIGSAAPAPDVSRDNTISLGATVPLFFWFKQREDTQGAGHLLDAARANRRSVELQTKTLVTQLYRLTRLAYETAVLNRGVLLPLARQDCKVALVAYQSGKVDFAALAGTLQRAYNARINYLTAANQFQAGRVALEQAMGAPIPL
jgi:cobalt-zinc-cadmium efflux system outer membrane protein